MTKRKPSWDMFSDEQKQGAIKEVIAFFENERGEEIGLLSAEMILDFFMKTFAEEIYRKGVKDAHKLVTQKIADLEVDLDMLMGN